MSYKFFPLVPLSIFLICLSSCDTALTPKDYNDIDSYLTELSISPANISFDPLIDGQKDTTVTFDISITGNNFDDDMVPYYSIFLLGEDLPSFQGNMAVNQSSLTTFVAAVSIPTNTIEFETYTILVTPTIEGNNSNYAQAVVRQTGVPINAPEILEVNNPEEVEIPSGSNTTTVLFTAKVQDIDGQSNIDKVFLNFRNIDGSILSDTPFEMLDDGNNASGDLVASDSVFTSTFVINSSNTPNNRTALYWAIDQSGLSSDTLETTFNIVDNE